jgi:hypothetical protein
LQPQLNLKLNRQLLDLDLIQAQFGEQVLLFAEVVNQELPMMFQLDGVSDLILMQKKISTSLLKLWLTPNLKSLGSSSAPKSSLR